MTITRKLRSPEFKAKIALEAIKERKTINEIAGAYQVHAGQVTQWKTQLKEGVVQIFSHGKEAREKKKTLEEEALYEQIGRLTCENNWLKKSLEFPIESRWQLIDPHDKDFAIASQCTLLGLARSSYYYESIGDNPLNLALMRLIDEEYTRHPFYGSRRMTQWLNHDCGYEVNRKRVIRLMQKMGLEAIYPKQNLSRSQDGNEKMPYLLRGLKIVRPNQVWSSDITYIRMRNGFIYLTVVLDWYSRYILAWRLSNTLDASFCIEALRESLTISQPEISNTDQGSQYTCETYISCLKEHGIKISMDGRGRALDNIFNERLWRSVKYEEVYLKEYETVKEAENGLGNYLAFYNNERRHQSLNYHRPVDIYYSKIIIPELYVEVK